MHPIGRAKRIYGGLLSKAPSLLRV